MQVNKNQKEKSYESGSHDLPQIQVKRYILDSLNDFSVPVHEKLELEKRGLCSNCGFQR